MIVLAVDPGTRVAGAALFIDGKLAAAAAIKNPMKKGSGPRECAAVACAVYEWAHAVDPETGIYLTLRDIDRLVAEVPQIYQRGGDGKSVGDPNDMVPLAMIDGALAAIFHQAEVTTYCPKEWGAIGKPDNTREPYAIEQRVRERLAPEEIVALEREWPESVKQTYDLVDAVAIGLKAVGRFERRRVYSRD